MNTTEHLGIGMTSTRTRQRLVTRLQESGIKNARVLEVIKNIPRHLFIDEALSHRAYEDTSLPIGLGQTISQPYIVAKMTELLLEHCKLNKILEIGTGSGYQAAVLSKFFKEVYSIERLGELSKKAKARLLSLKIFNTKCKHGNGAEGWSVFAPFDAILLTAAAQELPQVLLQQLAVGGTLIAPVGTTKQMLQVVKRTGPESFELEELEPVKFVPLIDS